MRSKHLAYAMFPAALLMATVLPAHADQIFTINATASSTVGGPNDEGTVTGTFATSDALTQILSYSLIGSAAPSNGIVSFPGFTYNTSDSSVTASTLPSQYFRIDTGLGLPEELQLYFTNGLTLSGGTLLTSSSYENEFLAGNRFLSGTVTNSTAVTPAAVTPEPSSLMLFCTGALGLIGTLRRRSMTHSAGA